jgi:DNA segregation ATPase FtsK/SpoIIIE, S-DNA-T family
VTETRLSTRRELELVHRLQKVADQRAHDERQIAAQLAATVSAAEKDFAATAQRLNADHAERRRTLESDFAVAQRTAAEAHAASMAEAEAARAAALKTAVRERDALLADIEHRAKESEWQVLSVHDADKGKPAELLEEATQRLQQRRRQIDGLERDARTLLEMRGLAKAAESYDWRSADTVEADAAANAQGSAEDKLQAILQAIHENVIVMQDLKLASWFNEGGKRWGWLAGAIVAATLVGGVALDFSLWGWLAGAAAGVLLGGVLLAVILPRGKRSMLTRFGVIGRQLDQGRQLEKSAAAEARAASERLAQEIAARRDHDLAVAQWRRDQDAAAAEAKYAADTDPLTAQLDARVAAIAAERDRALAAAEAVFPPQLQANDAARQQGDHENSALFDARRTEATARHDAAWQQLAEAWFTGFREVADELQAMNDRCQQLFPDWSVDDFASWTRPEKPPEAIRFGQYPLPLQLVKNGTPEDKRLDPGVKRLLLPAVMSLTEQPRLVITADGAGRRAAAKVLQLVMLRFLTSMPAGKLRLTIIDPSGLGENFAAFMHLADYDDQLVAGERIYTDSKQIDERLSRVSDHMEKVLQKYLRNEFQTLAEYNDNAGEVAEPYHVIVAANFPNGFSDAAARKLIAISQSGPRCGVYVLLSVDSAIRLPHEFRLDPLLADAVHLEWQENRFVWRYPLFEKLPLELDRNPEAEGLSDVLRVAGQQSREASKVEVPFSMVAPAEDKIWTSDCARELVVPIGRAGAKEFQSLRLGLGTSQHVVTAGKTGSGKSTMLHALITNAALYYSPDQVEFYLVDFKKGVEFQAYARGALPHARVIAIESEREFGVSVLERLDQELRRRGELFRLHGVQDVAGFRRAVPDMPMPRTLLIVDEFQELFVADDKLAQDAALLLDRLVRQGRAFGIHVLLGSQTLSGAYSLARSTIGQMAVRIALECSEADAHLILSDENAAARLLTRPGEAIYNDQNGLVAGNHPFQVVWLPDEERKRYLAGLRKRGRPARLAGEPTIVFEGNVPADPRDNPDLVDAIAHPEHMTHQEPKIWLGSAVRIEPSTNLVLRRQGGHNLAIIGAQEELAAGVLAGSVVALAAQQGEAGARFTILDGTRPESQIPGLWRRVADAVGDTVDLVPPRAAGPAVLALAEEVTRRTQSPEERFGSIYLVIHDLAQFRDLRQGEDDFSFSFSSGNGKPPAVDRRFRDILKEGPAVGVHVLLWCESYNSLTRCIDRLSLREIEFRVATQMSAADSTSLIDSPAATLLGEHRALLYRDDVGTQTKFRPYGPPTEEWLAWAAEQLRAQGSKAPV